MYRVQISGYEGSEELGDECGQKAWKAGQNEARKKGFGDFWHEQQCWMQQ
jgi:hypothetical protein